MVRKLKPHEKKLLKKVNFIEGWKHENNVREIKVLRRYLIQNREDYVKYAQACGSCALDGRLADKTMCSHEPGTTACAAA